MDEGRRYVGGKGKAVADLRKQIAAAIADAHAARRDWKAVTQQMIATAATVCRGSVDDVRALGFDVRTHNLVGALPAPTGLTVTPGKELGEVVFAWARGSARHGFLVQHAIDVTTR